MKKLYILWLRRRARALYFAYDNACDDYPFGVQLADEISDGRLTRIKQRFNATLAKLEALGETPPEERLL
jgi:hypothetical protein